MKEIWIVSVYREYYPSVVEFDDKEKAIEEYEFEVDWLSKCGDTGKVYLSKAERQEEIK